MLTHTKYTPISPSRPVFELKVNLSDLESQLSVKTSVIFRQTDRRSATSWTLPRPSLDAPLTIKRERLGCRLTSRVRNGDQIRDCMINLMQNYITRIKPQLTYGKITLRTLVIELPVFVWHHHFLILKLVIPPGQLKYVSWLEENVSRAFGQNSMTP